LTLKIKTRQIKHSEFIRLLHGECRERSPLILNRFFACVKRHFPPPAAFKNSSDYWIFLMFTFLDVLNRRSSIMKIIFARRVGLAQLFVAFYERRLHVSSAVESDHHLAHKHFAV